MLKSLSIKNFTVFSEATFEFSKGLNVIIGENETGKSHVLKLAYSVMRTLYDVNRRLKTSQPTITSEGFNYVLNTIEQKISALEASSAPETADELEQLKAYQRQVKEQQQSNKTLYSGPLEVHAAVSRENIQMRLADKLRNVFKPDSLGSLNRLKTGREPTEIKMEFRGDANENRRRLQFSFSSGHDNTLNIGEGAADAWQGTMPLFLPTHEVLTMPELAELYENRYLSIDETYYDLCKALKMPLLKNVNTEMREIASSLEAVINGKVTVDKAGRFYIDFPNNGKLEIPLIAEGMRKIATLIYLALNGALAKGCTLCWDEAESNLNPKLMVKIAESLAALAKRGVQVIVATHSLFLMKEFSLLAESSEEKFPARFFNCNQEDDNLVVEQGDLLEDLGAVVSLDQALSQDDREQAFYYQT